MKKLVALLLAMLMMVGLLAGCSGEGEEKPSSTPPTSNEPTGTPTDDGGDDPSNEPTEIELPLTEDTKTFSYWLYSTSSFPNFSSYDDNEFYQWMEEQTNVHLEFIHPPAGGQNEAFQTMILSKDYADFIQSIKSYYSGGVDKAIADGVLVALNEPVDQWMPNYRAVVYGDQETFIQCVSDEGNLWGVHHIVDRPQGAFLGLGVRQDWLDDLGLTTEDCETVDGMEDVLTQFMSKTYEGEGPLWLGMNSASYAYALNGSWNYTSVAVTPFINKDGTAVYGAYEGLKDYAAKMADWYKKGLINKGYIAEAAMMPPEDKWANSNIGMGDFVYTMRDLYAASAAVSDLMPDPDFDLSALTTPKLNAGDDWKADIHLRQQNTKCRNGNSMGITTHCDDLELACRYWDYAWSDEGKIRSNWGSVGEYGDTSTVSYIDETDANGDGHTYCYQPWTMETYNNVTYVQTKYAVHNGPTYSIWSREWCTLNEQAIQYQYIWDEAGADWVWPDSTTLTADEGAEASSIVTNANTAVTEWLANVITGVKDVDTYDTELIPQIESMGIARATEIYQAALDRYFERAKFMEE